MGYKFRLKNENLSASDLVVYEKFYFNEKLIVDTNLFASKKEDLKKIDTISDKSDSSETNFVSLKRSSSSSSEMEESKKLGLNENLILIKEREKELLGKLKKLKEELKN